MIISLILLIFSWHYAIYARLLLHCHYWHFIDILHFIDTPLLFSPHYLRHCHCWLLITPYWFSFSLLTLITPLRHIIIFDIVFIIDYWLLLMPPYYADITPLLLIIIFIIDDDRYAIIAIIAFSWLLILPLHWWLLIVYYFSLLILIFSLLLLRLSAFDWYILLFHYYWLRHCIHFIWCHWFSLHCISHYMPLFHYWFSLSFITPFHFLSRHFQLILPLCQFQRYWWCRCCRHISCHCRRADAITLIIFIIRRHYAADSLMPLCFLIIDAIICRWYIDYFDIIIFIAAIFIIEHYWAIIDDIFAIIDAIIFIVFSLHYYMPYYIIIYWYYYWLIFISKIFVTP
jgi:hypothetical protein